MSQQLPAGSAGTDLVVVSSSIWSPLQRWGRRRGGRELPAKFEATWPKSRKVLISSRRTPAKFGCTRVTRACELASLQLINKVS
mgnify:CR=1 FL=1